MITKFKPEQLDCIMDIWLQSNLEAHDFIDADYWTGNFEMVKEMLPQSELYVYSLEENPVGFIGMQENYIAGIFILKEFRSHGIGTQLLDYAKSIKDELELDVYQKNIPAFKFYKKHGFTTIKTSVTDGETEYLMRWQKTE